MDAAVRLIMRILLVPLGYVAAVLAGTAVIAMAAWRSGVPAAMLGTDAPEVAMLGLVGGGAVLFTVLLTVMWLPASIGVLMAEALAIRSWIFHAANGAVSAWIGRMLFGSTTGIAAELRTAQEEALVILAAGLAGGLAYWAIAGWSAGFWKPVYRRAAPLAPPRSAALR